MNIYIFIYYFLEMEEQDTLDPNHMQDTLERVRRPSQGRPNDCLLLFHTDEQCIRSKLTTLICRLSTDTIPFHQHLLYGEQWVQLHRNTRAAIHHMLQPTYQRYIVTPVLKKNQPCDVIVTSYDQDVIHKHYIAIHCGLRQMGNVPFLYTVSVRGLELCHELFDDYYYHHYLSAYIDTDPEITEAPPRWELYKRLIYQSETTHPFIVQLRRRETEYTLAKKRIVNDSITAYLNRASTSIALSHSAIDFLTRLQNIWHMIWNQGECTMQRFEFDPSLLQCYRIQGQSLLCHAGPYRVSFKLQWNGIEKPMWTMLVQNRQ
jgi:hypothetical protein